MDVVSAALSQRHVAVGRLDRMVGWSTAAHMTLLALVVSVPADWLSGSSAGVPEHVMTISLPGTVGPRVEGLAAMPHRPAPAERAAPQKAPARQGDEVRPAKTAAETGVRRDALGLTTGGGGTGATVEVGDFCCPEYIATMQDLINRNWTSKQPAAGITVMKFTIQRDGTLTAIQREKSSGQPTLDFLSERALLLTKQLLPLPAAYTGPALTVHLTFEYYR